MNIASLLTNPTTEVIMEVWIGNALLSALVQSLPQPGKGEGQVNGIIYNSIYNFLTILILDFKSFTQTFIPASGTTVSSPQKTQLNQLSQAQGFTLQSSGAAQVVKSPLSITPTLE